MNLFVAPCFPDEIQWFELCESTPSNKEQAIVCFGDLASAFRTLHLHSKEWTEDAVISVIDELMSKLICSVHINYFFVNLALNHCQDFGLSLLCLDCFNS